MTAHGGSRLPRGRAGRAVAGQHLGRQRRRRAANRRQLCDRPRASTTGISFGTLEATHLVVDVTGWFTGAPVTAGVAVAANTPPPDRRVFIVADSTMAGMRWNGTLAGLQGFTAVTDLESCRRLVASSCRGREGYVPPTLVSEIRNFPVITDEDILVIGAGYDDWYGRFSSDFDTVVATARAKGFHHIAWASYVVTSRYLQPGSLAPNYAAMNGVLAAKVASGAFPEVRVWDLNGYVQGATGWFYSDGIHETPLGSWGVADWISRHVRAFDDRPCAAAVDPGRRSRRPVPEPRPTARHRWVTPRSRRSTASAADPTPRSALPGVATPVMTSRAVSMSTRWATRKPRRSSSSGTRPAPPATSTSGSRGRTRHPERGPSGRARRYCRRACRCGRSASTSRVVPTRTVTPSGSATSTSRPTLPGGAPSSARATSAGWRMRRGRTARSPRRRPRPSRPGSTTASAAALLDQAEEILNAAGPRIRAELDADRASATARSGWRRFLRRRG